MQDRQAERNSLRQILGGRSSAIDATLPPVAYGIAWFTLGESIAAAGAVAVGVGALVALWRWRTGARPIAVLASLLAVVVAALIALRTGNAANFFVLRVATNAASALAWLVSIAIRFPLLGVVVGTVLGQRMRWRQDPDLLRAYQWASWVWVGQYVTRLLVFIPLWMANAVVAFSFAQAALTFPLVAASIAGSWWVLRRSLPKDHPGITHPVAQ